MTTPTKVFLDQAEWLEFHPVLYRPTNGDERLAALVGYMIGDGTIATRVQRYTKRSGEVSTYKPRMVGAFYSNDESDLLQIHDALVNLGIGTGVSVTKKKPSAPHLATGYQLQLSHPDCETLVESGVPVGKKTMLSFEVPAWIKASDLFIKRAFIAALFGAEATSPAATKGGVRTMRPIVFTMCKIAPTSPGSFFEDLQAMLAELGVVAALTPTTSKSFDKDYVCYALRISGLDNIIAFAENVGYAFCDKKAILCWQWLQYLKAYRSAAAHRRATILDMAAAGATRKAMGAAIGLTQGAAARLLKDIQDGKGVTAGHAFPEFGEWMKERWSDDRRLLRLRVVSCAPRPEPQQVWNLLVSSPDHSYLLANGANNFNSFESMSGRVYYPFDRKTHASTPLPFNPALPLLIGQDFNIDPMSSVVFQKQANGEVWAVDEICLMSSNTDELCTELERRYWRWLDNVTIYPDPAGAYRGHQRGESDLDIFRERGFKKQKFRRKHPPVADRVNAVNRMLKSADGTIKLRLDPRCKKLIEAFEQTLYVPGSREVDKKAGVEHAADAAGYFIEFDYPVRKIELLGVSI